MEPNRGQVFYPPQPHDIPTSRIGQKIPSGFGVPRNSDLYGARDFGDRHDGEYFSMRNWDRIGGLPSHHHVDEFFPEHPLVNPEEDLFAADGDESAKCTINCEDWEFFCQRSCECVHKDVRCDAALDCISGEDEDDCRAVHEDFIEKTKKECDAIGRIMCARTYVCISPGWLCDGDDDCGDYTDETHCGKI